MIGVLLPKLDEHEYSKLRAAIATPSRIASGLMAAKTTIAKMSSAIATCAT